MIPILLNTFCLTIDIWSFHVSDWFIITSKTFVEVSRTISVLSIFILTSLSIFFLCARNKTKCVFFMFSDSLFALNQSVIFCCKMSNRPIECFGVVRDHPRSLTMSSFDGAHNMIFYSSFIEPMRLSFTVFKIRRVICQNSPTLT